MNKLNGNNSNNNNNMINATSIIEMVQIEIIIKNQINGNIKNKLIVIMTSSNKINNNSNEKEKRYSENDKND